jgi:hypothetical protein
VVDERLAQEQVPHPGRHAARPGHVEQAPVQMARMGTSYTASKSRAKSADWPGPFSLAARRAEADG